MALWFSGCVSMAVKESDCQSGGNAEHCFEVACLCLLDETLKSVGPFYLVSVPREVKDPMPSTKGKYVTSINGWEIQTSYNWQ